MKRIAQLLLAFILGVFAVAILLLGVTSMADRASGAVFDELHVCLSTCPYSDIQVALDAANPGDTIKVATGVYTALHTLASPPGYVGTSVVTQVAYIDKSISLLGGFNKSDWVHQDPVANPTTMDADGKGRVVFIYGDVQPTIAGFTLTGGNSIGQGGLNSNWDAGGAVFVQGAAAVIQSNQIQNSNSTYAGAGVALLRAGGSIDNNSIHDNTLNHWFGGGIYSKESQITITNNSIYSNTVASGFGGGIYSYSSTLTLTLNTIGSNSADAGGGIDLDHCKTVLDSNTVTSNQGHGGAGIEQDAGQTWLIGNTIVNNTSSIASGGGMVVFEGITNLEENNILSNTVINGGGGGISLIHATATLHNNLIAYNTVTQAACGGVSFSEGNTIFDHNQVINNTSIESGGGGVCIYLCGSADRFSHNLIQGNNGLNGNGGGMTVYNCDLASFTDNQILQNYSGMAGGGINFDGTSRVDFSRNIISDNLAGIFGGGIYGRFRGDWINNVIIKNSAPSGGSGIYMWNSFFNMLHNTISSNTGGDKSGMVLVGTGLNYSSVNMTDTILVNQTMGITAALDNMINLNGVLWFNNIANTGGQGTVISSNVTIGDPLFGPDGYHLQAGSSAIDKGIDSGIHIDVDGQPRPYQAYDLGADEYWPSDFLKNTFLPFLSR